MSKVDRAIQKMRDNPRDWRIDSLEMIAKRLDIQVRKSGAAMSFSCMKTQRS
jgi:hypothetical protein